MISTYLTIVPTENVSWRLDTCKISFVNDIKDWICYYEFYGLTSFTESEISCALGVENEISGSVSSGSTCIFYKENFCTFRKLFTLLCSKSCASSYNNNVSVTVIPNMISALFCVVVSMLVSCILFETAFVGISHVLTLKALNFWKFTSYCSLKPLWLGMGEVAPARTSPTLHPPSLPTVHQLSRLAL